MGRKFGLIGTGISHSKSPLLFSAAYPDGDFSYILIDEPDFKTAITKAKELGLTGVNVTTPFKDMAFELAKAHDPLSEQIEASNLLLFDSIIKSYNTDYYGAKNTLMELKLPAKEIITVVLGCGGAGRAAALAARDCGHSVIIANRSIERASAYAKKTGTEFIPLANLQNTIEEADIIIDTLPVSANIFNIELMPGQIYFEANYSAAKNIDPDKSGSIYVRGEYWLINQAIPSYKIFTGQEPDINAMRLIINM
jgi:shikimate dehydrogenase